MADDGPTDNNSTSGLTSDVPHNSQPPPPSSAQQSRSDGGGSDNGGGSVVSDSGSNLAFPQAGGSPDGQRSPLQSPGYMYPVSFHWTEGGSVVELTGSFLNNWNERIPLTLNPVTGLHTVVVELPLGIYMYKFVVDGVWRYAPEQATMKDAAGNTNNVISVTDPNPIHQSLPVPPSPKRAGVVKKARSLLINQFLIEGVDSPTTATTTTTAASSTGPAAPAAAAAAAAAYAHSPSRHNSTLQLSERRLVIVMVGLPARGKSFISRKLCRFLKWLGYVARVFNIGDYRRQFLGHHHSHDFFRADNPTAAVEREKLAMRTLDDLLKFVLGEGDVGIFDGTNTTRARRKLIVDKVTEAEEASQRSIKVIFIEIISDDQDLIEENLLSAKLSSPDYVGIDPEKALSDFRARIKHYEDVYESIDEKEYSFIKIFEVGQETQTCRIFGYLPSRIVFFLMNMHIDRRPIFLVKHGETTANEKGQYGTDSTLTERGLRYIKALTRFFSDCPDEKFVAEEELLVWSSTHIAGVATSLGIACAQRVRWKAIDDLFYGICDGLTPDEVAATYPEVDIGRRAEPLKYRYPRGESYEDVFVRVEPVLIELERQMYPICVVAGEAVLQCLFAYFADLPRNEVPDVQIPQHTVIKLVPGAKGTDVSYYPLDPDLPALDSSNSSNGVFSSSPSPHTLLSSTPLMLSSSPNPLGLAGGVVGPSAHPSGEHKGAVFLSAPAGFGDNSTGTEDDNTSDADNDDDNDDGGSGGDSEPMFEVSGDEYDGGDLESGS